MHGKYNANFMPSKHNEYHGTSTSQCIIQLMLAQPVRTEPEFWLQCFHLADDNLQRCLPSIVCPGNRSVQHMQHRQDVEGTAHSTILLPGSKCTFFFFLQMEVLFSSLLFTEQELICRTSINLLAAKVWMPLP